MRCWCLCWVCGLHGISSHFLRRGQGTFGQAVCCSNRFGGPELITSCTISHIYTRCCVHSQVAQTVSTDWQQALRVNGAAVKPVCGL